MQIELTIAGLCLIVEDETRDVVHVILPATASHHAHVAKFLFPKATGLSPQDVTGYEFDLQSLSTSATSRPTLSPDILDITEVCPHAGKVDGAIISGAHKRKAGHLRLRGGRIDPIGGLECGVLPDGKKVHRARQLQWVADCDHVPFALKGTPLGAPTGVSSKNVLAESSVLRVGVVHAMSSVIPQTLEGLHAITKGDFAHFSEFYPLFTGGCKDVPHLCSKSGEKSGAEPAALLGPSQCMPPRGKV